MSKSVRKHCSILNYLEDQDETLYKIIKHLCMGGMFKVRKGSAGLTFLRPDKSLVDDLKKLAYGNNPEEAVSVIQSMLLLDYLPDLGDFEDRKSDISTFLRKKLPVTSVDGKSVTLKNGGIITVDENFEARSDRIKDDSGIAVYLLSKAFVPTDTEPSSGSRSAPRPKKAMGGADFNGGRVALFNRVLLEQSKCRSRNPAVEVLVSLLQYLNNNGKQQVASKVRSQLSGDALASLAIVLQPYRRDYTYLGDEDFGPWAQSSTKKETTLFYYGKAPGKYYKEQMELAGNEHKAHSEALNKLQEQLVEGLSKPTIVGQLNSFYTNNLVKLGCAHNNPKLALAEAELRVFSALLQQNNNGVVDYYEMMYLFQDKCNLVEPYICNDRGQIMNANVGFYYSTIHLIARSDALLYIPKYAANNDIKVMASDGISNGGNNILQLVSDDVQCDDSVYGSD